MEAIKLRTDTIISAITKEASVLTVSHKSTPKPDLNNWEDVAKALRISLTTTYKEPPVCIEFISTSGSSPFATLGNFSAIIGKAKSRKTFLISLLLAYCFKTDVTEKVKVFLPDNKKRIIHIDTEQSQYHVSRVINRVLTIAGTTTPENLDVYGLRALAPADRLFLIEQIIYNTEDLGILVIDGIRDLISDINSPDEATMITSKLLKWTEERNIHIITVLHQNKGDNNARGHLGSEIVNKAESVISVEKDNDISTVQSEYVRGKDFSPFAFGIDELGTPYMIDDYMDADTRKGDKKMKSSPFDYSTEAHMKMLEDIFKDGRRHKYNDLLHEMSLVFQQNSIVVGRNKIIEFQKFYHNKGWIDTCKEVNEKYAHWFKVK